MKKKINWKHVLYSVILIGILILVIFVRGLMNASKADKAVNDKVVSKVDDLPGAVIGVQLGTTGDIYASDYEGDAEGTIVDRYNKGTDAIQALKSGKINCVILDEQPALAYTAKNPELSILEEDFALEEYAVCVDYKNGDLKSRINAAFETLQQNGVMSHIIDNYVGSDEEKGQYPYIPKDMDRQNGTLRVATNASFKPYEYYENGKITGLDMDMMQAVCDELGMELEIIDMEFDSIITAVVSGRADVGAAGMTVTEDRLKNIDFTNSYVTAKQVIIVRNGAAMGSSGNLVEQFKNNFLDDNRYQYILKGLGNTLIISVFSVILGVVLGGLIAVIRTTHDRTGKLDFLDFVCRIYLTIVRGTPAMVQLLIFYYIILVSVSNKILVAVIAFGLNSAAYVAEVVRSGIMSVPKGQMEAGRSLGLSYKQTMISVILPQALKNILPALCNEFISLIKETSISGYIAIVDLTKGADIIRSNTYDAYMPLFSAALCYLVIVMLLTATVNGLERRLRGNER